MSTPLSPPLVMGLRMEQSESEDDFDDAFGDESSISLGLPIQAAKAESSMLPKIQQVNDIDEIKKFPDVSPFLTSLCSALPEYVVPEPYQGDIDLIPLGTTPENVLSGVAAYIESLDSVAYLKFLETLDRTDLSESHECQLEMLRYSFDQSANIEEFDGKKLDSRLSSLLFWLLSCKLKSTATERSAAYCLKSAMEYIKSTTVAPITVVFPDFTLSAVLTRLCEMLIQLFPSHPIIPSYLYRIAEFTNSKDAIIAMIPAENNDEDDDSDFSSSFFDDLQPMQTGQSVAVLSLGDEPETNPLELSTFRPTDVVVLQDAPTTMTYLLSNGKDRLLPNEFVEWVGKVRPAALGAELPVDAMGVQSQPVLPKMMGNQPKDVRDPAAFDALYGFCDATMLVNVIPDQCDETTWSLFLPLLHFLCVESKGIFSKCSPDPRLLNLEYEAHHGIMQNSVEAVNMCIENLVQGIPDTISDDSPVAPLKTKRQLPEHFSKYGEAEAIAQALVDLIVLLDGRSPLTFVGSSGIHGEMLHRGEHPVFGRQWRVAALYKLYSEHNFPPYLAFRCAFALGVSMSEVTPAMTCRFLFEGLYVLLTMLPSMKSFTAVKSAFFVFGESMDAAGKYFYCALLQDNASSLINQDKKMASKAAQIAHKNKDSCRAVFYYLHALQIYREMKNNEEVLYTAQIVASIYKENGLIIEGIQLLNDILMNVYELDGTGEKMPMNMSREYLECTKGSKLSKSKGSRRAKSFKLVSLGMVDNGPKPDAVNTILTAVFLCNLLIKAHFFSAAENVVEHVLSKVSMPTMIRILDFMRAKIDMSRNNFSGFIDHITAMKIFQIGMVPKVRLGSQQMFVDVVIESIKMLAKGYYQREDYVKSFFWSEMLCHYSSAMNSVKHLATGLQLRGMSLTSLYKNQHLWAHGVVLTTPLDELQASIGRFSDTPRTFTRNDLLSEALSSFLQARLVSDRIGKGMKILDGYVQFGILLGLDMLARKNFDKESKVFELVIDLPKFETELPNTNVRESLIPTDKIVITNENAFEHLNQVRQAVTQLSKVFMDPIGVIQGQILSSIISVLKGKSTSAENLFNFAFHNLGKYFFNGHTCLVNDFDMQHLLELRENLRYLLLTLITFEKEFINSHLIIFDMIIELINLIRKRLGTTVRDCARPLVPRSDVQQSIEQLVNPVYPDFSAVLRDAGIGQPVGGLSPRSASRKTSIKTLWNRIKRNIKLLYQGQIGERKLFDLNAMLCKRIEAIANEMRRNRCSLILTEMSPRLSESVIFMTHVYSNIISYIPSMGTKKVTRLGIGNKQTLDIGGLSRPLKVSCGSSVFPSQFMQKVFETICTDTQMKRPRSDSVGFNESAEVLGKILFGDISMFLSKFVLRGMRDAPWDSKSAKSKKGHLFTITVASVPLQIVADSELHALPFELFFPKCAVVRSMGFFNNYGRYQPSSNFQPLVFRWRMDRERESEVCYKRSVDLVNSTIRTLGAGFAAPQHVDDFARFITFPFPLFDASRDTEKYVKDFPFCDIKQMHKDDKLDGITNGIFIFTYSDLVDWPAFLEALAQRMPHAWYMFVPSSHIAQAFAELKEIFKHHELRKTFFEANRDAEKASVHLALFKSPFQFVTTIQLTLIHRLKVPVAIVNPTRNLS